jgi:hypothetical protein
VLIAEPEKAILDFCYIHADLKTAADFRELRIDATEFQSIINPTKLQNYLVGFADRSLAKRIAVLLQAITHA